MKSLKSLLVMIGLVTFHSSALANEPTRTGDLIGTWCDTPLSDGAGFGYVIQIWESPGGQFSYHQIVQNEKTSPLAVISYRAEKRNRTWYIDNDFGEYARIGDDAHLRVYDRMGLITTAKPVPSDTNPAQCR